MVARGIAAAHHPGEQLPVAARPPVLTRGGDVVARWELLHDLDVRDESGPGEGPLEQVVAEERPLGHPVGERCLEGVDVVDPLARIGTEPEQILVYVGNRGGIRVDSARAGVHALKQGAFAPHRQGWRDARLHDRVALEHVTGGRIEPGPAQRVSHLAHQPPRRIPRQPGIRIERYDVADIRRNGGGAAAGLDEGGVRCAAQQLVQLVKFAALALPAHPLPLPAAPHPPPMQQHEPVACGGRSMQMVQSRNALGGDVEQSAVFGRVLGRRIDPVRKQSKVQLVVPRGEIVDLEPFDVFLDGRASRQERGNHDQGAQIRRDPVA